jgi:hypothetical protein
MRSIRNITAIGTIFRVWEGYFGTGGFCRKDWIYFGLEFLGADDSRIARSTSAPDPIRNNIIPLRDRPKAPPADEALPKALAAHRRAR